MSVVVRMEMPDWCPCVLAEDNNGWYGPCFAYNGIPERAKEFDQCVENMERPSWCPIICSLPEGHGRLVDADAYSAEMKDRKDAAWKWRKEAIAEEDEVKLARAEGAFTAFVEAKLTMDKHIISP